MKWLCSALIASALVIPTGAGAIESIIGHWNTIDDKTGKVTSTVELYEKDAKLFGKIIRLTDPNDETGKPKSCSKCSGVEKNKPIVGMVILKDLAPEGDRYKGGTILDPDDGKVYKAEIWREGNQLKVRGYVGLFYRTQTWTKGD
jgi:uncharacterized protein (DUF2147 family)